jgi:hypothetical protein
MSKNLLLEEVGPGDELPGFDIDDPVLPQEIADKAMKSGGFPYDEVMKRNAYREELEPLQIELLKLQRWMENEKERLVILFEARDVAGWERDHAQELSGDAGSIIRIRAGSVPEDNPLCQSPARGLGPHRVSPLAARSER